MGVFKKVRSSEREEDSGVRSRIERKSDIVITAVLVCVHVPAALGSAQLQNAKTKTLKFGHRAKTDSVLGPVHEVVSKHDKVHQTLRVHQTP